MRRILMSILIGMSLHVCAQSTEKDVVMKVVNRVFEAMRTNDSTLLKTCFTQDVRMSTVFKNPNGETQFREGSLSQFLEVVGKKKTDVYNEPIWNERVQIDGPLASVWVDYAFYLNTTFSHCGVDAFHLINTTEGWKIFNLVDTRRKADCEVPENVKRQYEK